MKKERLFYINNRGLTKDEFAELYDRTLTKVFSQNSKVRDMIMRDEVDPISLSGKLMADEVFKRIYDEKEN